MEFGKSGTVASTMIARAQARPRRGRGRGIASALIGTALAAGLPAARAEAITYVWSGGSYMPGTTSPNPLLSPDILSIETAADKAFAGDFTNLSGRVDWSGGFLSLGSATVTNNSLWRALSTTSIGMNGGSFVNNGTFRNEGTGDVLIRGGFVNNGTIDVETGRISYKGGVTFNDGTIFTGAGTNITESAANFNGAISSTNLVLSGGAATGTAVVLSGTAKLSGGSLAGDWTLANGSMLVVTGGLISGDFTNNGIFRKEGANEVLVRGGFVNNGTIDAAAGTINYKGGITFNDGTIFTGAGTNLMEGAAAFNGAISSTNLVLDGGAQTGTAVVLSGTAKLSGGSLAGDWTLANGSMLVVTGGLISGDFTNNGIFRKEGANEVLVRGGFVNNGTIDAAAGTINYKGGITFNDGTIFTGAGINLMVGGAAFNGAISSTNLVLDGGAQTGTAAVLSGTAKLAGGSLAGDWTLANGSTLAVTGDSGISGSFTNDGGIDWNAGDIHLLNGALLANNGTVTISGGDDLVQGSGGGLLLNHGLITKTGGGDTDLTPMLNSGTVDVEAGSITLSNAFLNFGTLAGTSTFVSGTVFNNGTVAPGALGTGIGALTLQGDYMQTSLGAFDVQLGFGGLSDLFQITGAASLDGALDLFCTSCAFNVGDIFTILDAGGPLTGMFANTTATGFNPGFAYSLLYDTANSRVQLRIDNAGTAAVPEPAAWAMLLLGFGLVGGTLRTGRVRAAAC